jgi:hypothetical protein
VGTFGISISAIVLLLLFLFSFAFGDDDGHDPSLLLLHELLLRRS